MLFNSLAFILFFSCFFGLYWIVFAKWSNFQNLLLLTGSYFFYASWDWRFLLLLFVSSLCYYIIGIQLGNAQSSRKRRLLVMAALTQGLGILFFFKYYDFFVQSLVDSLATIDIQVNISTLGLILPMGISFYTFRGISYILDINSERINYTKEGVVFFSYLAFFPSLLAGPIDKARDLIPQLETKRFFDYDLSIEGLRQVLWGLFKKIVIANNCALVVNPIFDNYELMPSSTLWIGAFFYSIQVYADFSGYSDMAIGLARLLGFEITKNFNFPYFAQNIADFWQKWHISLTSWLTEYVYTPLSFILRDYNKIGITAAIIINFILVGLWHGANWTFIVFGLLHGIYFIPIIFGGSMLRQVQVNSNDQFQLKRLLKRTGTFVLVMMTMIIFRSTSLKMSVNFYKKMFTSTIFERPDFVEFTSPSLFLFLVVSTLAFMTIEWYGRKNDFAISQMSYSRPLRWSIYLVLSILIFFNTGEKQEFIYFQF